MVGKNKKSQFKIQQMSFMLLAVVLFFVLVGLFWIVLYSRNLKQQATQLSEEQAIMLSEFLSGSSEFTCGDYCVDTDKLIVLAENSVYKDFWPNDIDFIKIRKIYPKSEEDIICNKINYPNCNIYNIYGKQGVGKGSFVSLCRYEQVENYPTKICELGKLIIGYKPK